MATVNKFEELQCWKRAIKFTIEVYERLKSLDDRSFKNQILRALYSISNNIAEGFERETPKEFKRFLVIAKASNGEVRSMLYLADHFNYISTNEFESFKNESEEISKMIGGLINYLNSKIEN